VAWWVVGVDRYVAAWGGAGGAWVSLKVAGI
jgi:hypothetical protein